MTGPARPRVTRRRAETRARLLGAAFRVFADKGFGQVRIEDVCAAAGYTRGAFYSQFGSLDELFLALYDERADSVARAVAAALAPATGDAEAAIERTTASLLLDRDWLLVRTDVLLHAARHPELAAQLVGHRAQLCAAIEGHLRAARERLALPPALPDVADAARAVVTAYDGVCLQLLLDSDPERARAWLRQLLTALLGGE